MKTADTRPRYKVTDPQGTVAMNVVADIATMYMPDGEHSAGLALLQTLKVGQTIKLGKNTFERRS